MKTGIIYKAENVINGKLYIGQTTCSLRERIRGHYCDAKRNDYKFSRALRKYSREDWLWEILEDNIPKQDLDKKEIKYIAKFDSFLNGYNSNIGGNSPTHNRSSTIYELYHPDYGIVKGTLTELKIIEPSLGNGMQELIKGKYTHIKGFVLSKNKDQYKKLLKIYNFYHPKYGEIECTFDAIIKTYLNGDNGFRSLLNSNCKYYKEWVFAENKNKYNEILKIITLEHVDYGIKTMRLREFTKTYNLDMSAIGRVLKGKCSQHKGWKLVTAPELHLQ